MVIKVIMLVVFFGIMIGVGFYARKQATDVNGFVLGGRSVGPWLTAFAYGTSYFSAVIFIGYAGQFGWKYGIASTWIGIGNAILGHNFPFYMNFKGGKGIAASAGLIFALAFFDWKFLALGFCTFFIALIITKYVSFSSLCLMTGFLIEFIVWGQLGMVHNLESQDKVEAYILVGFLTALSYIRHKENIKRLINGTERKIGQKKEA